VRVNRAAFLRTSRRVHAIVAVTRKDLEEICVRAEKVRERAMETLDTVRETRWRCETERQRSRQPVQEPTGHYLASFEDGAGGRTSEASRDRPLEDGRPALGMRRADRTRREESARLLGRHGAR
jgi:hypothetical protein